MANPYDVSPREAWLETQYKRLNAEVTYMRQMNASPSYSLTEAPDTLFIHPAHHTLQLAASCHMARENYRMHVYARSNVQEFGETSIKYFVNDMDVMDARHAASVMEDMHKRLVFDIGRHLWDPKK